MPSETTSPLFVGRLIDGKTAGARDVNVRLGEDGVEILIAGGTARVWTYGTLQTAEPLTDHAIDALLTSSDEPGAALFVAEAAFARALPAHAPRLTARAIRWRHAMPWVLAAALVAVLVAGTWLLDLSPARAIAKLLPDRARGALGAEVLRTMTEARRVCRTHEGDAALRRLTERLAAAAGGARFKVVVVDWDLLNAFAVPGEQIVLTRGLITNAASPDEVAGVLAHEMGHGIEMHPETAIVRAIGLSAATDLLFGGSGGSLANVGLALAQLSYTRAAERAADTHALEILKGARIAARGLADFFKRVSGIERHSALGKTIGQVEILRTHPRTEERRQHVDAAPLYPSTPGMTDDDWAALKTICGTRSGTEI